MRKIKHWTFNYLISRAIEKRYRQTHPNEPWLTPQAVRFLEGWLQPTDKMLEFGSGRSTLWFADRVDTIVSVEHQSEWYDRVQEMIRQQGRQNVIYLKKALEGDPSEYPLVARQFEDNNLDVVLVDGRLRDICTMESIGKLKPGGLLVLDNADVYLPSSVKTPNSDPQRVASALWQTFLDTVKNWRIFWTCNGVSATAFFFKPPE